MNAIACLLAALLLGQVSASSGSATSAGSNLVLDKATIVVRDEAKIPAMEAGVLTKLSVREGDRVKADEDLALIDDRQAQAQVKVAEYAEAAAIKRAL